MRGTPIVYSPGQVLKIPELFLEHVEEVFFPLHQDMVQRLKAVVQLTLPCSLDKKRYRKRQ